MTEPATNLSTPQGAPNPIAALITQPMATKAKADQLMEAVARAPEVIPDHDTNGKVGDFIKQMRVHLKRLEDERKSIVGPINEGVKRINARFKVVTDQLNTAIATLNKRTTVFLLEQERLAREKEAELRREQEDAALEQAQALEEAGQGEAASEALDEAAEIQPIVVAETHSRGDYGTTTGLRDNWCFELVDIGQVALEYLLVDAVKVNKIIRSDGVRDIPGLRIFNDRKAVSR